MSHQETIIFHLMSCTNYYSMYRIIIIDSGYVHIRIIPQRQFGAFSVITCMRHFLRLYNGLPATKVHGVPNKLANDCSRQLKSIKTVQSKFKAMKEHHEIK